MWKSVCLSVLFIHSISAAIGAEKATLMQLRTCRAFIFFIGITYVEDHQVNKQTVQIRPLEAQEFKAA